MTRMLHLQSENKLKSFPRENNLEWLRLVFALQVVLSHVSSHLNTGPRLPVFFSSFPGVPAFFFVSGFLIYSSYLNSPGKRYFENRFLRIFPGLLLVTLGGMVIILMAKGWSGLIENKLTFLFWFVSQITVGQSYNPELFRNVGVGVINGSLWTITTEILFYLIVPVIVYLERRFKFVVVGLIAISLFFYVFGPSILSYRFYRDKSVFDFIALTPIVWGWMFGCGIMAVKHYDTIDGFLGYIPILSIPLLAMIIWGDGILFQATGNRLGLVYFLCYAALILWFSFCIPATVLPFDLSYGAYIWHMPIINLLKIFGIDDAHLAIVSTCIIAALSWFLVEKPILQLKQKSIRPL